MEEDEAELVINGCQREEKRGQIRALPMGAPKRLFKVTEGQKGAAVQSRRKLGRPRIMNFESAEGLEFDLTEDDISRGVAFDKYPIFNEIYQSEQAIEYSNFLKRKPNAIDQMSHLDSQHKRSKPSGLEKVVNPFKEDAFSLGLTLLQMATLYGEEELMGARDLIYSGDIELVLGDVKYREDVAIVLKLLLTTDSE